MRFLSNNKTIRVVDVQSKTSKKDKPYRICNLADTTTFETLDGLFVDESITLEKGKNYHITVGVRQNGYNFGLAVVGALETR